MRRCPDVLKNRSARMTAALAPPPRLSTSYQIGATRLVLESCDDEWRSYVDGRYAGFPIVPDSASFTVRFECTTEPVPEDLSSPLAPFLEAYDWTPMPSGFSIRSETVSADIDLKKRHATLRGPRAAYPLDNLLRHLLPALKEQGILFHAAALEGVLACGPSGAGKSTLAALSGENALCDELCAVKRDGRGRFRITSLPFWTARPGSSKLSAVLFLRHGPEHRLSHLDEGEALRRLTAQTLWPVALPSSMEGVLDQVLELIRSVPTHELAFAKEASVWNFIEENVLR